MHRAIAPLLLLAACQGPGPASAPNRWSDERLWPVLEAQEHRDSRTLCALLEHEAAAVRGAAALAFASVQDTASAPCLQAALADPVPEVRAQAAFALGFVADSAMAVRMVRAAADEPDRAVQEALLAASFLARQRRSSLRDPEEALRRMDEAPGHEAARAADLLRRMPDSLLRPLAPGIVQRFETAHGDARQFLLLAMGKLDDEASRAVLARTAQEGKRANERVNARRAYGMRYTDADAAAVILGGVAGAVEEAAALEVLERFPAPEPKRLVRQAGAVGDPAVRAGLLGLAMRHAPSPLADSLLHVLLALRDTSRDPFLRCAAIRQLRWARVRNAAADLLEPLIRGAGTSAERIAAFQEAMRFYRDRATGQVELVLRTLEGSRDPGLVAAVGEALLERPAYRGFDPGIAALLRAAMGGFALPLDLEAARTAAAAIAHLHGLPPPAQQAPAFNHPIDPARLRALRQGQRYRIVTGKGEIIIATDADACPGSSLAFDSLATAGYYDGKAFHRMVPNFVVQGGCPRGDGYGSMPWTLRTEVGSKPFSAGSVGLASAGRDTESCQFFITHSAAPHLDGRYTRFGEVVSGMDVVWRLQAGDVIVRVERMD